MPYFLPALALLLNAFIWGVSWWPFRLLQGAGLHPLWATALLYALALAALLALRPGALRRAWQTPGLALLALAAGLANVCFNWAVTVGDVVRVVLLFYLMPAWAVLLAWKLLGEVPTPGALLRLLLACAGVVLVVVPPGQPLAQLGAGLSGIDALAVAGGFFFALTNVTLRRLHQVPEAARMAAMFAGAAAPGPALGGGGRGADSGIPDRQLRAAVRRSAPGGQRNGAHHAQRSGLCQRLGLAAGRRRAKPAHARRGRLDRAGRAAGQPAGAAHAGALSQPGGTGCCARSPSHAAP